MNDTCRVCLDKASKLYPLKGEIVNCDQDISEMISYCTSIKIELTENLPIGVCVPCFKTVRIAYNFIVKFKENNDKLLKQLFIHTQENINLMPIESNIIEESSDIVKLEKDNSYFKNKNNENEDEIVIEEALVLNDHEQYAETSGVILKNEYEIVNTELDPNDEFKYEEVDVENIGFLVHPTIKNNINCIPDASSNNMNLELVNLNRPKVEYPKTVVRRKIKIKFSCPVCPNTSFNSFENELLPHMGCHTEIFPCNLCSDDENYNSDTFLKHFLKCHRYQCPYCGKSFNKTGTLTAHIKTHSSFRYTCSAEGCNKSFPTQWTLKKHEAVHSNSYPYSCDKCNLEFKTYDTYMYHQKKHNGKKFLCMYCGRTFIQSIHLKYHIQQHTGIKHFKCDMCEKSYTASSQLKKHKKRHHPVSIDNPVEGIDPQPEYVFVEM